MATLTLTVLRCPDYGSAAQRQVPGGELTIGRGAECDWALPDPGKSLSRKHCTLEYIGGSWQVRDLSSNGTFVNSATMPIGRDQVQVLQSCDRLLLGDYEIEARIEEAPFAVRARPSHFEHDIGNLPFGEGRPAAFGGVRLPGLDDPVFPPGLGPSSPFGHDTAADHAPMSANAYMPPPAVRAPLPQAAPSGGKAIVPDNWLDTPMGDSMPTTQTQRTAATPPSPAAFAPPPAAVEPVQAPPWGPALGDSSSASELPTLAQAIGHPVMPAPKASPSGAPRLAPSTPPAAPPQRARPSAMTASGAAAQAGGDMSTALLALLSGGDLTANLAARAAADPENALRNAGALLRVAVAGIRALLIGRGAVKREFRIEQTVLRTHENNPLKFTSSDAQALAVLLDPGEKGLAAMQDSINDLTCHQVAVLAATQAAARALLEQLEPSKLEAEDTGGGILPGATEKRLWTAYKRQHARLLEQFEDDFESAFGKAFARAYEQAVERGEG